VIHLKSELQLLLPYSKVETLWFRLTATTMRMGALLVIKLKERSQEAVQARSYLALATQEVEASSIEAETNNS